MDNVCILLGISPASDCSLPTFRNPLSVPSTRAGCRVRSINFFTSVCLSVCLSVCPHKKINPARTGCIFMKVNTWRLFENLRRKLKFYWSLTKMGGTLEEELCNFVIVTCWILLGMRNVSKKFCIENQYTQLIFNMSLPPRKSFRL